MPDVKPQVGTATPYAIGIAAVVDILIIIIVTGIGYVISHDALFTFITFIFILLIVFSLSLRVLNQWNRMAVLRLGRYVGVIGPGPYLIVPLIDATPVRIDLRVISTAFKAERTLTKDNVPVDVDAILFWQVRNPENAILNVQSYIDSVLLASQTAMRDIIGKSDLSLMLSGRDKIGRDIQKLIEDRVTSWGIEATSVEIRDVTIPAELQNAMARVATSDREKQARVILAESETLAADKMIEAAHKYEQDPFAMQLRGLNMMYEISLAGKNVMVFIPTESKGFSLPLPMGIAGLQGFIGQQGKGVALGKKGKSNSKRSAPDSTSS